MSELPSVGGYRIDLIVQGFPGKSVENGGLGWSSIVLLRGHGRVILVDTGSFSVRRVLLNRLANLGINRADVTDVLLTHSHYDHMMNWVLFPNASVAISGAELDWALTDPIDTSLVAEVYVQNLAHSPQLRRIGPGGEALPGIGCLEMPGHTPHHLIFILEDERGRLILAADAAKNRAELLSAVGASTLDAGRSAQSIEAIARLWRERDGAILVAGHDLPMLNAGGEPLYLGDRRAGVVAWFDKDVRPTTTLSLSR